MAQRDGQGVGGIHLGLLRQLQQVHDHQHHLFLVGATGAGHGLLDLAGTVFGNLKTRLGGRDDRRAPSLPKREPNRRCAP